MNKGMRTRLLVVSLAVACVSTASGQDPRAAMEASIAKQRAAVEQQRAAARVQARVPQDVRHSFFTVPWNDPPVLSLPERGPECDPVPEDEIGPIVQEISSREGLTPELLHAVIEKESAYLPCAISPKGAQGLMQLMPATAAGLGVRNAFDVRQNVAGGARYLRELIDRYGGNEVLALAAYNAGPGRVDAAGGVPELPETLGYVTGILSKLRRE